MLPNTCRGTSRGDVSRGYSDGIARQRPPPCRTDSCGACEGSRVYCPNCEIEYPDGANFCSSCGRPLHRGAVGAMPPRLRWEYKDLVVPLEASSRVFWEFPQEARARFAEVV